jgi:hypothetical protein
MRQSLSYLAILFGIILSVLKFLDWYLNDKQKAKLADISIKVWNWLDEAKKKLRQIRFDRGQLQVALIILTAIIIVYPIHFGEIRGDLSDKPETALFFILIIALVVLANVYVMPSLIRSCSDGGVDQYTYVVRLAGSALALLVVVALACWVVLPLLLPLPGEGGLIIALVLFSVPMTAFFMGSELIVLLGLSLAAVAGLSVCMGVVFLLERLARRVAETADGTIYALIAVVGLFGALLEIFGKG